MGVEIPARVNNIQASEFSMNQLSSLRIESGKAGSLIIGEKAFEKNYLEEVEIPARVNNIEASAFSMNKLRRLIIEPGKAGSLIIGEKAFENNHLEEVEIPARVNDIKASAFSMNQLRSLRIDSGKAGSLIIGEKAFENNNLEEVEIPARVNNIKASAFSMNKLRRLIIEPGQTKDSNSGKAGSLVIGEKAFYGNNLENVEIPARVKNIKAGAFQCSSKFNNLKSVIIEVAMGTELENSNITGGGIDAGAFKGCVNLKIVKFLPTPTTVECEGQPKLPFIHENAFDGCRDTMIVQLPKKWKSCNAIKDKITIAHQMNQLKKMVKAKWKGVSGVPKVKYVAMKPSPSEIAY